MVSAVHIAAGDRSKVLIGFYALANGVITRKEFDQVLARVKVSEQGSAPQAKK